MAVRRRTRGIDHGKEVAFAHRPAPGFFDTAEEDRRLREAREGGAGAFRPVTVAELEGPRRRDVEERLQKIDIAKEKMRERRDAPGALAHNLGMNDPEAVERRSRLRLPAPQVSDAELYEIARMSEAASAARRRRPRGRR